MANMDFPGHITPQLSAGEQLAGRFVIIQFIARGGMGEVYEASDLHLQGKHCALKTLRREIASEPSIRQRFEREVLLAREITHPNVCPTYDLFREDSPSGPLLFLTMKLLQGESLATRLKRCGFLSPAEALPIIRQMAAGLDAAHKAGIIHRDFKPGNVMLETVGADVHVSITDFGISRFYEADTTLAEAGRIAGTPGYMAPELLQGRAASPASDVYAFGVALNEMLTGHKPQSLPGKPKFLPPSSQTKGLPKQWDRVILGCLEYDPERRFQSASDALAGIEFSGPSGSSSTVQIAASRRQVVWLWGSAGAVAAGGAWLGWPRIDALFHPLPTQRFVALLAWPPDAAASASLLKTVLDAAGNRLVRAETSDKNLLVISSVDTGQAVPRTLPEVVSSLGANLVLGAAIRSQDSGYTVALRIFEASSGRKLRERSFTVRSADLSRLAERAGDVAAAMLDAPDLPAQLKDRDEAAMLSPAAFQLFSEAAELLSRPNEAGLGPAIEKYQKVLEAAPRFALGYADLALAYTRKFYGSQDAAFLSLASKNADLAVQYNPGSAKGVLARATVALYSGNTQEAVDGFAKALQMDPGNPQILLSKARLYRNLAQPHEEENVYREIIRSRPNYWPAYNELGQVLYRQSKYREAAEAFGEAAAVAPRVAIPLANQGTMYALLGQDKNAEEAFRKSLERAPNEFAYSNLGSILFKRGDYRRALTYFEKARDLSPRTHQRWRNLADCYAVLGEMKRASESYEKAAQLLAAALAINSSPGASWAALAFYHAKIGRRADAESDLKNADARGLDQRARFAKVQALAVLGKKEEALQLLLMCMDEGLSAVDVELALDLTELRSDPRYLARVKKSH